MRTEDGQFADAVIGGPDRQHSGRLRFAARTARRLLRSRPLRQSSVALGVMATGLIALYLIQSAFTLTPAQIAQRDLGTAAARLDLGTAAAVPGVPALGDRAAAAALRAGATGVAVELTSVDIQPAVPRAPFTLYLERPWQPAAYPDRFVLLSGRWPSRPGEVAVTAAVLTSLWGVESSPGRDVPVLSGLGHLDRVGVVQDRFADAGSRILAAPGTLNALNLPAIAQRYRALDLRASVTWRSGDGRRVAAAVDSALDGTVVTQITRRRNVLQDRPRTFAQKYPLGYRVPALALPFAGTLLVFGIGLHGLRRSTTVMRDTGVPKAVIATSISAAAAALALVASVLGTLAGLVLGVLARPILGTFAQAPLSPLAVAPGGGLAEAITGLAAPVAAAAAGTAVGACWAWQATCTRRQPSGRAERTPSSTGAGATGQPAAAPSATNSPRAIDPYTGRPDTGSPGSPRWRTVRHAVIAGAVLATLGASFLPVRDVAAAMTTVAGLAAVLLLLTPELVGSAVRLVPDRRPSGRLARRQLEGAQGRTVAAVLLLSVALAGPLAFATMLATMIRTDNEDRIPSAAPGQVKVLNDGTQPAPEEVVDQVSKALPNAGDPVLVSRLSTADARVEMSPPRHGIVMAVESVQDAARLSGHRLTVRQRTTLASGGVLTWGPSPSGAAGLTQLSAAGTHTVGRPLRSSGLDLDRAWEGTYGGLLLTATARDLGLPIASGEVVFTGVSEPAAQQAKAAVLASGLDPYYVKAYEGPSRSQAPPVFYLALLALSVIVILTVMFVARAQAATLRRLLGALTALGVPARWARRVLLAQVVFVALLAEGLAVLIAGPVVALAVARLPGFNLTLPWTWLAEITGLSFLAIGVSAVVSSRHLAPADRDAV